MEQRELGALWPVSELTLGGGGLGQVWGATTRDEAIATAKAAVDHGITLLDLAPLYGRGEAEQVIGAAFGGNLPEGVRLTTKCMLGTPAPRDVKTKLERHLTRSLESLKVERVDIFFLHSNIFPAGYTYAHHDEIKEKWATRWDIYVDHFIPAVTALQAKGLIGAWGITGTGLPHSIMQALRLDERPAVIQAVTNLMDSAGDMRQFEEPAEPRNIIRTAVSNGIGVMGIRAVATGALTAQLDRPLPTDDATFLDYERAAPYRALCKELGEDPALLAHRYALAMDGVDTVVLGVKNREELNAVVDAVNKGPLSEDIQKRIDALRLNFQRPRIPVDEVTTVED